MPMAQRVALLQGSSFVIFRQPGRSLNAQTNEDLIGEERAAGAIGVRRTLRQACYRDDPEAQGAFEGLMIHWVLQVARRIAFRCVLHRCGSLDIRR